MKLSKEMNQFLQPYGEHTLASADAVAQWAARARELETEVERLRGKMDVAKAIIYDQKEDCESHCKELERLRAENDEEKDRVLRLHLEVAEFDAYRAAVAEVRARLQAGPECADARCFLSRDVLAILDKLPK